MYGLCSVTSIRNTCEALQAIAVVTALRLEHDNMHVLLMCSVCHYTQLYTGRTLVSSSVHCVETVHLLHFHALVSAKRAV
jgi:hypothetical protein